MYLDKIKSQIEIEQIRELTCILQYCTSPLKRLLFNVCAQNDWPCYCYCQLIKKSPQILAYFLHLLLPLLRFLHLLWYPRQSLPLLKNVSFCQGTVRMRLTRAIAHASFPFLLFHFVFPINEGKSSTKCGKLLRRGCHHRV